MGPIGPTELIIVLVIVLVIFGPKRLPQLGRSLGGGMREFKNSITSKGDADADDEQQDEPALAPPPPAATPSDSAPPEAEVVDAGDSRDAS
jgi:sec-independent protein translocase protein TatA